jgi:3-deoxy-D-manno-octulosonic-acid transferase
LSLVYAVLSYLVFGLAFPFLLIHPKLRQGLRRRLGLYTRKPWPDPKATGPRIWFHGASAGDLIALLPTIKLVRAARADLTIVVSTMTNSGYEIAKTKVESQVNGVTFLPYDFRGSTRRAMAAIQPDVLVLEYAEIWPNLIHAARKFGSKIVLTNGRFSESLMLRYRLFYLLIGNPLKKMLLLLMRDEREGERAARLGAHPKTIHVTGNTKFDNLVHGPAEDLVEQLRVCLAIDDRPIFVAGSTHEGEEADIFKAFIQMRKSAPGLRCILVPRYVERASKVASIAQQQQLKTVLRSSLSEKDHDLAKNADVIVVDSIGELTALYKIGSFAFVGGSFVARGGQNILEPAGQGRPVLFGPNMVNFRDSVEVLQGRGGIQLADVGQLGRVGQELLAQPEELKRLGEMAKRSVAKVRGASERNATHILSLLSDRSL